MKKQYVKPTMLVEDFVLNDYIAACTLNFNLNSGKGTSCSPPGGIEAGLWETGAIYVSDMGTCMGNIDTPEFEGQFCYHSPGGAYRGFAS